MKPFTFFRRFDWHSLNLVYNQDDTVLSLSIKHCPALFKDLATYKIKEKGKLVNAINQDIFEQLSTDFAKNSRFYRDITLMEMAIRRDLVEIIDFLNKFNSKRLTWMSKSDLNQID